VKLEQILDILVTMSYTGMQFHFTQ